jgi:hypothetical protein
MQLINQPLLQGFTDLHSKVGLVCAFNAQPPDLRFQVKVPFPW